MRKKTPRTYLLIFVAVLALMSLPKRSTEIIKSSTVALLTPLWQLLVPTKTAAPPAEGQEGSESTDSDALQRLQLENAMLSQEIAHIKEAIQHELKLISQFGLLKNTPEGQERLAFLQKRFRRDLQKVMQRHLEAVPARVIFRAASSWSSSLWIDVGTTTNEVLGKTVVAKNSPVVVGSAVVGVVDYVGKAQARVKLITDSGLTPSVRVLRGAAQDEMHREKLDDLLQALDQHRSPLLPDPQEQQLLAQLLAKAKENVSQPKPSWLLAKGELHGASQPLWRRQGTVLKGIGFNYDYADDEGPARDLRSGRPADGSGKEAAIPIIQPEDLLVTTGMDGVFPPGLLVAKVTKLHLLKEGDYYYELEAVPVVADLDDLSLVFILPPVGYDADEQPPPIGLGWESPPEEP